MMKEKVSWWKKALALLFIVGGLAIIPFLKWPKEEAAGTLNIYAKKHKIIVESALTYTTDVRIVNLAGMTINSFTIEPGESVETRINNAGVYIVESTDGRYIKKLSVR